MSSRNTTSSQGQWWNHPPSSGEALEADLVRTDLVGEAVSCDHLLLPSLMGYLQSRSFLAVLHLNPLFFCAIISHPYPMGSSLPLLHPPIHHPIHFVPSRREEYMIMLLKIMPMHKSDWIRAGEAIWFWHFLTSDCNCKILFTQFEVCNFTYLKVGEGKKK